MHYIYCFLDWIVYHICIMFVSELNETILILIYFIMKMTLKQICDKYNNERLNLNDIQDLIELNGFTSLDSTIVAENETHTLDFAEDCITLTFNSKSI